MMKTNKSKSVKSILVTLSNPAQAKIYQRFFKTGKGEYGEGDVFRGIRVPELRSMAKQFKDIPVEEAVELLHSDYHEDRMLALFILIISYRKGDEERKEQIYQIYLSNTARINNWDLVDCSAEHIVGEHLWERDRSILEKLAKSEDLWERRIAVIATFNFIKKNDYDDTLKLAELLLNDKHDLIHKAVGWMLREIGNRDLATEEIFLRKHYRQMPRTMLRYAIEKFEEEKRQKYLKGEIPVNNE